MCEFCNCRVHRSFSPVTERRPNDLSDMKMFATNWLHLVHSQIATEKSKKKILKSNTIFFYVIKFHSSFRFVGVDSFVESNFMLIRKFSAKRCVISLHFTSETMHFCLSNQFVTNSVEVLQNKRHRKIEVDLMGRTSDCGIRRHARRFIFQSKANAILRLVFSRLNTHRSL